MTNFLPTVSTIVSHDRFKRRSACALLALCLAACGGGGDADSPKPPGNDQPSPGSTYTVGGTVAGLAGSGLVVQLNGAINLAVQANGAFAFATGLAAGATYSVNALTQPSGPAQTCAVANGSGTANANVVAVQVNCSTDPLTLLSANPADRSGEVERNVQPALAFSAAIDPATVTSATIMLAEAGGPAVPGTLALNAATVGMAPSSMLWPDTEYRLGIDGVLGSFGEPLTTPLQTRFVTRDGRWQAAAVTPMRTSSSIETDSHRVALARDGTAVAVWSEGNPAGQRRVWASRRGIDGVWLDAVEVGPAVPGTTEAPALVMEPDGTAHVTWSSTTGIGGRQQVFASRLGTADADWSAPVQLSLDALLTNIEPALGVGANGTVYAAWKATGQSSSQHDIHVAVRQDDGSWSNPVIANEANGSDVFSPALAVAGDGRAQLVWVEQNGADYVLKWRPYRSDVSNPEPVQGPADIGMPAGQAFMPFSLIVNAAGDGVLVWQLVDAAGAATQTIWAAVKSGTSSQWEAPLALDGDALGDREARAAVDEAGNRFVVWLDEPVPGSGLNRVIGRRLDATAAPNGWEPARLISDSPDSFDHALAVDARGNALVLWAPTIGEVRGARFTQRQGWKTPETLAVHSGGSLWNPRVAFDGSGSAVAIWLKNNVAFRATSATGDPFSIDGARFD